VSLPTIRKILETELAAITPAIATAHENEPFKPTPGAPYQQAFLLTAQPENIEIGPGYTEQGIFQVNLFYPLDEGAGASVARAALIRAHFPFAATFSSGGITVTITATPEIAPARADGDRFMTPVKVRWSARIAS
jgi:hypothetical protein